MRVEMRALTLALFLTTSALAEEPEPDRVLMAGAEDTELNAAMAHAKATLSDFLAVVDRPPAGASGFKVKVRFEDRNGVEHIWVVPFQHDGLRFVGTVADEPEVVKVVKYGKVCRFTSDDITDWGYTQNGKQKGSFTVCVFLKRMPQAEADRYRKDYGFEC